VTPTILTASGRHFNLLAPTQDMIEIEDIAHALSHICRFTGHTKAFYSVAEHSILTSHLVPQAYGLEALLHDAAEAYIGDVSSPLKSLLPEYRAIEHNIDQAIRRRFCLPEKPAQFIKDADLMMLATEKRDLMPAGGEDWELLQGVRPSEQSVYPPMAPASAQLAFMHRYLDLTRNVA
jgi:uncharacterized protein